MAAILQISGPVTMHAIIARSYRFLMKLTAPQFLQVTSEMEIMGLGTVVTAGTKSHVFIKKSPEEAALILRDNPDLCCPDYYATRYNKQLSKQISLGIRHHLSKMKLVPAKLMM